jgi:hypothetical protein
LGVYSIMLPDDNLIRSVTGLQRLVILGCAGCANESLAFDKNLSLKAVFDPHMGQHMPAPDAILAEAGRLKEVLNSKVKDIRTAAGMGMCSKTTGSDPAEWENMCRDADGVVALCCVAGMAGIKTALGRNVRVIPGMKTVGVHYCFRVFDPVRDQIYIDREKSSFLRIFNRT